MKILPNIKTMMAVALLGSMLSCGNDDSPTGPSESLIEIAEQQAALSTFVQAVERAEITETLNANQAYTVLAPSNTAFNEFLIQNGYSSIDAIPVPVLKQLLLNHVITADIDSQEFNPGYLRTNAVGNAEPNVGLALFVDTVSGVKFNGIATLITPNLDARNGILHIVDNVIKIPTVYDHIAANPALSTFRVALGQNPGSGLVNLLSGTTNDPFTVFAPQNTAFSAFLDETENDALTDFTAAELESILNYHIIETENILSPEFFNNQVLTARNSQNITITLTGGGKKATDVNGRACNIIFTDIQAGNGIIHVLDRVLMPN